VSILLRNVKALLTKVIKHKTQSVDQRKRLNYRYLLKLILSLPPVKKQAGRMWTAYYMTADIIKITNDYNLS